MKCITAGRFYLATSIFKAFPCRHTFFLVPVHSGSLRSMKHEHALVSHHSCLCLHRSAMCTTLRFLSTDRRSVNFSMFQRPFGREASLPWAFWIKWFRALGLRATAFSSFAARTKSSQDQRSSIFPRGRAPRAHITVVAWSDAVPRARAAAAPHRLFQRRLAVAVTRIDAQPRLRPDPSLPCSTP